MLYTEPYEDERVAGAQSVPPVAQQVRWPLHNTVLQRIDLPALVSAAERSDSVVELTLTVGDILREGSVIARIHSTQDRQGNDGDHRVLDRRP